MPPFLWLSRDDQLPAHLDLRALGWRLLPGAGSSCSSGSVAALLDWRREFRLYGWSQLAERERLLVVGADRAHDRAALLELGFGDATASDASMAELAARLLKLKRSASRLPRVLTAGPITLDLLHRDARDGKGWIGLHPREFALLWRLAETPGRRVSRTELLRDVWRMQHVPETNSLEVHVSRLRAKLAISRCAWLVRTHPDRGYYLAEERRTESFSQADTLDRQVAIGNGVLADP